MVEDESCFVSLAKRSLAKNALAKNGGHCSNVDACGNPDNQVLVKLLATSVRVDERWKGRRDMTMFIMLVCHLVKNHFLKQPADRTIGVSNFSKRVLNQKWQNISVLNLPHPVTLNFRA